MSGNDSPLKMGSVARSRHLAGHEASVRWDGQKTPRPPAEPPAGTRGLRKIIFPISFKVAAGVAAAGVALMVAGKAVSLFADLLGIAAAVLPLLLTPYDPKTRTRNLGTPYRFKSGDTIQIFLANSVRSGRIRAWPG